MELEFKKIPQRLLEIHLEGWKFGVEYKIDLDCDVCGIMKQSLLLLCQELTGLTAQPQTANPVSR